MKECIRFAPNTLADSEIVWLYREGVEFNSVTGGWIESPYGGGNGEVIKNTGYLYAKCLNNPAQRAAKGLNTANSVNLEDVNQIKVLARIKRVTVHTALGQFIIAVGIAQSIVQDAGLTSCPAWVNTFISSNNYFDVEASLNVSSLSGAYNIGVFVRDSSVSVDSNCEIEILKVWGEK